MAYTKVGSREAVFALALVRGDEIGAAVMCRMYDPSRDTLAGYKVDAEGSESFEKLAKLGVPRERIDEFVKRMLDD